MRLTLCCLAIVALYVFLRLRRELPAQRRALSLQLACMAAAGFVGEDSMIRAYGFYAYDPRWTLFIDKVPLAIPLIWPVVLQSAFDVASRFRAGRRVLVAVLLVLADAWFIEPIAVRAGLWSWTRPGPFGVPLIGPVGWAAFAGFVFWAVQGAARTLALRLGVALLATHLACIALWLSGLHRLTPPAGGSWVVMAWTVSLGCVALIALRRRHSAPVESGSAARPTARSFRADLLLRVPGALFFFGHAVALGDVGLLLYACAFAPPYLLALVTSTSTSTSPSTFTTPTNR